MKTEEEYILSIKRKYQRRKIIGMLSLLSTIILCVITYMAYVNSNETTYKILESLQLLNVGDTVTVTHIENIDFTNTLVNSRGINTGILLGSSTVMISVFIAQIFILFFGMRKEKLLIKYYELSKKTNK